MVKINVFDLESLMFDSDESIKKVNCIQRELVEEYFRTYDSNDKDKHACIIHDYYRNAIFAEIALDYIDNIQKVFKELNPIIDQVIKEKLSIKK